MRFILFYFYNLQKTAKVMLRGEFISLHLHISEKKRTWRSTVQPSGPVALRPSSDPLAMWAALTLDSSPQPRPRLPGCLSPHVLPLGALSHGPESRTYTPGLAPGSGQQEGQCGPAVPPPAALPSQAEGTTQHGGGSLRRMPTTNPHPTWHLPPL